MSRPGTFLKTTAYLGAIGVSVGTVDHYGRREVNRAVFKMDKIEPKPGKLWERTKHWTVEDAVVGGAISGAFLALNPRALPGVYGWKRFFGTATVGAAIGGYLFQTRLVNLPLPILRLVDVADETSRQAQYDRLLLDANAKNSLSRFGKMAFAVYSWPKPRLPFLGFSPSITSSSTGHGTSTTQAHQDPHALVSQEEIDRTTLVSVEFNKGELKGPDIEQGYRAYKDTLADRDVSNLQDWLERLQETRKQTAMEARFIWQQLTIKEEEFYKLHDDDREKDILRRELQLLNNMGGDFCARDAILSYHIADALKRLHQVKKDPTEQNLPVSSRVAAETPTESQHAHPHLVAEQIRLNWQRQKQLLSMLEQSASMHKDIEVEAGSPQESHFQQLNEQLESMKKNIEATERILKEFEEQLQKVDEPVKP